MKTLLAALALVLPLAAAAQTKITETFVETPTLDWEEYADKQGSALVQSGYIELKSLVRDRFATILTELPVFTDYDFKLSARLLVPKIDDTNRFGILIDRSENFDTCLFLLKEEYFGCFVYNNGKEVSGWTERTKLKGGKNRTVEIVLERKAGRYIFTVNNMEIFRLRRPMNDPIFGFYTENESSIRIEEFTVEQDYDGSEG
ncbi:hypothetical protein [Alistipes sp.]|uniref:hypothetical protein n=1 Tax=Alistipes sp. TaxID=1872444 RepID=UPI003AF06C93